ncbi:MAG: exosome complex RNA-binding protein Rrp4 [Candidatus Aenigmarchaeota archaeon]|nr:exosome complex RNA-binding protein Rrp4 [Candidatus Aenigmarchaeota archaeon]
MAEFIKKERDFVVPGDEIISSMDYLPGRNCLREGNSIYAKRLGIVNVDGRVISVIPLTGVYFPRVGDMVIGEVEDVQSNGWVVNINSAHSAYLPLSGVREFIDTSKTDLSRVYGVGEVIYANINSVVSGNSIHLSMQDPRCRKFRSGRIVKMNPSKIPRLIGRQGSMIMMIKDLTGCRINVGQNGIICIEGEKEDLVIKAIEIIEHESQSEGLTDKISLLLGGSNKPHAPETHKETQEEIQAEKEQEIFDEQEAESEGDFDRKSND